MSQGSEELRHNILLDITLKFLNGSWVLFSKSDSWEGMRVRVA